MLEKPAIQDDALLDRLQEAYDLPLVQLSFLPLGADQNTAVYRAITRNGTAYLVKLRGGIFKEITVTLPEFLHDQGISHIIAPLKTRSGSLWSELDSFKVILYPFIEGRDGTTGDLSDQQWVDLGRALNRIHSLNLPQFLQNQLPQETYTPRWRESLRSILAQIDTNTHLDPINQQMNSFLLANRAVILDLVERAGRLAPLLQAQSLTFVPCHADIHEANVLIDLDDHLYIIDWDDPMLAPKERDLMYIGAGICGIWNQPRQADLFYQGYGPTKVDPIALAYYRYERIVQDLAIFYEEISHKQTSEKDRKQSLCYVKSNFDPGGTIDIAYRSDSTI